MVPQHISLPSDSFLDRLDLSFFKDKVVAYFRKKERRKERKEERNGFLQD